MERIQLNHWFVGENELSISLLLYFVRINICQSIYQDDLSIYYQLDVIDQNQDVLEFGFDSLEDAMMFTEEAVNGLVTRDEIIQAYNEKNETEKSKHILVKRRNNRKI